MKRLFLCVLCFLVLCSVLSCTKANDPLFGRWEITVEDEELGNFDLVYHFTEEGEVFLEQKDGDAIPFSIPFGTFEQKDDLLTITSDGKVSVYHFLLEEDRLILSAEGEEDLKFHRV